MSSLLSSISSSSYCCCCCQGLVKPYNLTSWSCTRVSCIVWLHLLTKERLCAHTVNAFDGNKLVLFSSLETRPTTSAASLTDRRLIPTYPSVTGRGLASGSGLPRRCSASPRGRSTNTSGWHHRLKRHSKSKPRFSRCPQKLWNCNSKIESRAREMLSLRREWENVQFNCRFKT